MRILLAASLASLLAFSGSAWAQLVPGGVTWPTSGNLVLSNGTNSPAGLAPVNGDCVVGSGGAWTAGSCGSGAPGGTTGQIQFNNAGAFGGLTIGAGLANNSGTLNAQWSAGTVSSLGTGLSLFGGVLTATGGSTPVIFVGSAANSGNTYTLASTTPTGFTLTDQFVVRFKAPATNTGAATLNVNSTGATAVEKQLSSGLAALAGGEIVSGLEYDAVYQAGCTCFILTNTPGSAVLSAATNPTVTAAQWASWTFISITTAAQTVTLPATSGLAANGGIAVAAIGNSVTVTPNAADSINGGTAGASVTISSGLTAFITTDGAGHIYAAPLTAGGGSGNVSTAGTLTANQIVIGQGTQSVAVDANASLSAGALSLGTSGTAGSIVLGNATSGTVTIQPVTGALGSVTASLPANTGTIAELNLAQTWSAAQSFNSSDLKLNGSTSGTITLNAAATAGTNTITLPAVTGTAITSADSGTVTGTMIASGVALAGSPTTTTQAANDNSTKIATTAYVDRPVPTTSGTTHTFAGKSDVFICTGACTLTVPVPSAGVQYCAMNNVGVSSAITFSAIGSSAAYGKTDQSAYGTAGTGTAVSSGAIGDKLCFIGLDSTHYNVASFNGTWVMN